MKKRFFLVSVLSILLVGLGTTATFAGWRFALIGDLPYDAEQEAKFVNLINEINEHKLAFVVHDGDLKSGSSRCDDTLFQQRLDLFQMLKHPFIFIFGDNEWTDCHRASAGSFDPLERLTKLRELFTQGNDSFGQHRLRLTRQSDDPRFSQFRENVLWTLKGVVFVGLHVVGSNNNLGRTPEADAEYAVRNEANLVWMRQAFTLANLSGSRGIMLIIQANPYEVPEDPATPNGFSDFLSALEEETLAFAKPVVLVHGDSHYFRIDKPMIGSHSGRRVENFTRLETFGSPDVHWVRATVNSDDPELFSFRQEIVEENLVDHLP